MTRRGLTAVPLAMPMPRETEPYVPAIVITGESCLKRGSSRPSSIRMLLTSFQRTARRPHRMTRCPVTKLAQNPKSP